MKTHPVLTLLAISFIGIVCGCGKPPSNTPATPPTTPPEKGTMQTAVEGFTGKTAVDQGLKAKDQIKAIKAKRDSDQGEIMN